MTAVNQTAGDRAYRYASGAEVILRSFAEQEGGDLAWGLHMLADDAGAALSSALKGNDMDVLERVSLRYCQVSAIISVVAKNIHSDLLCAGEMLLEEAKLMLDAEVSERLRRSRPARPTAH